MMEISLLQRNDNILTGYRVFGIAGKGRLWLARKASIRRTSMDLVRATVKIRFAKPMSQLKGFS